jgi:hypothetical protein
VLSPGRAGHERASRLQYPGLRIGQACSRDQPSGASAFDRTQEKLGGDRLDPVASQVPITLDRIVHVQWQPLAGGSQRGQHPTEPLTADAELGLDLSLERLVGQLGGR